MTSIADLHIHTLDLFPIRVYHFNISDLHYNELVSLADYFSVLKEKSQGRTLSNYGGWQSDENVINSIPVRNMVNIINDIIMNVVMHVHKITDDPEVKLRPRVIRGCWGNINYQNDFNLIHTHPGCWYAGCLYLKTPENCGGIGFYNSSNLIYTITDHNTLDHEYGRVHNMEPKFGDIFLFPAGLPHYTYPNKSDEPRISMAFNIA